MRYSVFIFVLHSMYIITFFIVAMMKNLSDKKTQHAYLVPSLGE